MTEQDLDQTKAEALVKSMGVIPNDGALTPLIRAVSAGDKETLRRMFRRLSPQTIYRRFHTPYPSVPAWMLDLMIDVDHRDRESLVVVAGGRYRRPRHVREGERR